ncbi:MAG: hypothetical protein GY719_17780 [bacterium]|nr:hypothetical protein [bacterium]
MPPERSATVVATLHLLLALFAASQAAGHTLIFADGFESGDLTAWSSVVMGGGAPACVAGPAVSGALAGDLGPAPGGAFEDITCVEIRNDRGFERAGEVAFSGIPVPRDLALTDTSGLALIGPGNRLLAAQFDVLSRWGGPVDDSALPIRWLQVSVQPRVTADGAAVYALRRYDSPPVATDPFAATIAPAGPLWQVDTGLATFTLDPANPALFDQIAIDFDDDVSPEASQRDTVGGSTIYSHAPGAGPRMETAAGTVLDTSVAGRVTVDPGSFTIVEAGPVKVVVEQKGHFSAPGGETLCNAVAPAYERFGYTVLATFSRASRDVVLQVQFRNECSDAFTHDWFDDAVIVKAASWELPLDAGLTGTPTAYHGGAGALAASPLGFAGLTLIEQRKGAGNPWLRRARVLRDAATIETAEAFEQPFVALADGALMASAQMPWMRYREPQAVAVDGKTLSLRFISEPLTVGEARGIWNLARLTFAAVPAGEGATLETALQETRDRGQAELERGLLVRAPLPHFNAAGHYASLGTGAASPVATYYADTLGLLHGWTVDPGGQWHHAKTFGSQLWPDIQFDQWNIDNPNPAGNTVTSNYWNPSGAELTEFLRSGDPKWVWDFALPQSWRQGFTTYLNLGDHSHGNRNGFSVSGSGSGEGHWNRDGNNSSDDYNYNMGMQLAYALRPNAAFRDRFAHAGRTVVERYDIPWVDQEDRDPFVNGVDLGRGPIQHFEHLANCAEFVPGARGSSCQAKLDELLEELAQDNLSSGVACGEDIPQGNPCGTPQQFMMNAHIYHFFHRLHANYGDVAGILRRALIETPRAYYTWAMPKLPGGTSIATGPDWPGGMDCTLTPSSTSVVSCAGWTGTDPTFFENKPHTVALLLMAHELDPAIGLCQIARQALDELAAADAFSGYLANDAGWFKGSSQMMQGMAFGVGGYEVCSD